jgi:hypothetical protein
LNHSGTEYDLNSEYKSSWRDEYLNGCAVSLLLRVALFPFVKIRNVILLVQETPKTDGEITQQVLSSKF